MTLLFAGETQAGQSTHVRIETSMGNIVVELEDERAPLTVANFLEYVKAGQYSGTIFHRVIPGFVIQGGGYTEKLVEKPVRGAVINESGNGLSNKRGTLGMARGQDPHSGNCQFYINVGDNYGLDPQPERWGYAVFGKVIQGMDVVQKISETATNSVGDLDDVPIKPVVIEKVEIVQ